MFVAFYLTNAISPQIGIASLLLATVFILKRDEINAFKWILFLLPNIRILDVLGFTYGINILLIIASIRLLFLKKETNKLKYLNFAFDKMHLVGALCLFIYEFLHVLLNPLMVGSILFNAFNIAFDFFVGLELLRQSYSLDNYETLNYSLICGILNSVIIFLMVNPTTIHSIMISAYRLGAYGTDPNYISVYIVVAMAVLLLTFYKETRIWDIVLFFMLIVMGLLTVSKMCIFCMIILVVAYFIIALFKGKYRRIAKLLLRVAPVIILLMVVSRDLFVLLWDKFLDRFSGSINLVQIGLHTSGRNDIFIYYIDHFFDNTVSCIFGRGLDYFSYYKLTGAAYVAHNTYLDFLLSWGFLGCALFIIVLVTANYKYITFYNHAAFDYLPLVMMLIMLFYLSCMSSDMFWYIAAYVLLPFSRRLDKRYSPS